MNTSAENDVVLGGDETHYWKLACENFRKICTLHKEGHIRVAEDLTRGRLSWLIARWSEASRLSPAEKRLKLINMFDEEGRRAGESDIARRLFSARMTLQADRLRRARAMLINCGPLSGGIDLTGADVADPFRGTLRKKAEMLAVE